MKIVSLINYKGGVGKTTITANLAAELAYLGHKILAIDLDPQASLTFSLVDVETWRSRFERDSTIKNWYDAFIDEDTDMDLAKLIVTPEKVAGRFDGGRLDLICSHLGLINIDLELATRLSGASPRQVRNNYLRVHSRLQYGLQTLDPTRYTHILIDCPPNFNIVTKNALVASDWFLVPAKPDYLSTLGIDQLRRHVAELVSDYNECANGASDDRWTTINPRLAGVLFTLINIRNQQPISSQSQYIEMVRQQDIPIMETMIRENNTIYADAPEHGVPVVLQNVSGSTYSGVKEELKQFAMEFLETVQ